MKTFPKNSPRKKIDVLFHSSDGRRTIRTTGVEVTPFVIHKEWDTKNDEQLKNGRWQITHLFTGKGLHTKGSYKFCKAVAEGLMDEPLVWLPCETMWSGHPDNSRVQNKLMNLKQQHESLGRYL